MIRARRRAAARQQGGSRSLGKRLKAAPGILLGVDARAVLRQEFDSEPGSFMHRLYVDRVWDRSAFSRLERAMREVCRDYGGQDQDRLERWLAEGYFVSATWVRDHTSHPSFPRPDPRDYYEACLERLWELADWFFRGYHVYQEPHDWEDL